MREKIKKLQKHYNAMSNKKKCIIKAVFAIVLLIFAAVFFVLNKDSFYALDGHGNLSLLKKKVLIYFACFLSYVLCMFVKNPLKETGNAILNLNLMQWFPLVCFILVETCCGADIIHLNVYRLLMNVLLYMVVMYFFYAITASVRVAVIGITVFAALFAAANVYLLEFRQIPLLASDLTVIKTAMNVAGDFSYKLNADIILLICFVAAVICFSAKLVEKKKKASVRIIVILIYGVFLAGMLKYTLFSGELKGNSIYVNTFRPIKSYHKNGGLLTFVRSIQLMMVDKPEGYDSKEVKRLTASYESDSASDDSFMEPNVIVVMNEAFSDLQSVGSFETNEEVIPFYNSLTENTVKGFAYVSVFGGQTANSEFEFLTGNSQAFVPRGATPYQLYVKEYLPSLTGNLELDGYQGMLALHPFNASGYNRISAYENLGFDRFLSQTDFEDPTYVRNFISDQSDYDKIISEYEAHKEQSDKPFYLFNVTMQNHSAYDKDFDNLPNTIEITTPECKNANAERYLNLIHISDEQTKRLVEYFKGKEDPTVIVLFGDHEPGLSDSFYGKIMGKSPNELSNAENMEMYKVPFFIWANYDIEEQYIEKTSLNYLHSIMLDVTGMKKSGYNKYLLSLMKDIPAMNASGYFGADGKYYGITDETSPYYDKIREYNILEYNLLFDNKRQNAFFEYRK